jgi:RNA polymerase sigma factor (sigma-70 family)
MRFLQRHGGREDEASDLRQEIYVRVYQYAQRSIPTSTKAFILQVARNLIIDRARRQNVVSIETIADVEWQAMLDDSPSSESFVAARQELRLLQAALDDLPPKCRRVVCMRRVEGLSQKEVADRLGIAEETVENQVARGMRRISDALGDRRGLITTQARRYNAFKKNRDVS